MLWGTTQVSRLTYLFLQRKREWYHETEPKVPSSFGIIGEQMGQAYDTDTVFSDATFDTASRHSAVSENVVYTDIIKPRAWIKELTSDEEREVEEQAQEETVVQQEPTMSDMVGGQLSSLLASPQMWCR